MAEPMKFFSFNKPMDWGRSGTANLAIGDSAVSIAGTHRYGVYRTVTLDELEGIGSIADLAVGAGGRLFLMDERANLWVYDPDSRHKEALFREGHRLFTPQAKLAACSDVLFIADPAGEWRIAAISASNGQLLWTAQTWNGRELYPLAITADRSQRVYTVVPLDIMVGVNGNPEVPEGGRIAVLEWNAGEVVRVYEQEALVLDQTLPVELMTQRYYAAADPEGGVAVLDAERKLIVSFEADGTVRAMYSVPSSGGSAGLSIDTNHHVFVGESGTADRFIMQFDEQGIFRNRVVGLRGRADKMIHDSRNRMAVLNREAGDIRLLELQERTMPWTDSGLLEAFYISSMMDTTESETEWHKVWLDADIPEETQIRISYFASDEASGWVNGQYVDYEDYWRNEDIPIREKLRATEGLWSVPIINPKDALLMHAVGRYLWFKLHLIGSETRAPVIRKLRVYFPRTSLISYLPPLYQEGTDSFLNRFLSMFGTFFDEMEESIDRVSAYFDPDTAAGDVLKWLGGWLAVSKEEMWEESKLRLLIKQAPELYKLRGTRLGLTRMLKLYTGVEPFIVEYFQIESMQESSGLWQLFTRLYGDNPYTFCVMLPPETIRTDTDRLMIERIIDDQKPAYTEGRLIELQPWMYADMHTYLGVNTYLSEPTLLTLDERFIHAL
ncbi:phage tail protein [Paenibacillus sp. TAB 01]|uniref:phage tail protein n=1 Tax=Paenibacillus sp. TAB 01 TaxID=3368988 RepID=UPI003750A549